jgi:biopolymer transport protein ExbD
MKLTRRPSRADVPAMAMGDIAFNLLIFFVILARAQDDSHLQWTPAKAANLESSGHSKVSVLVDSENKLYLNGREIGIAQLSGGIESLLGNLPAGQRTVLLKVHGEATATRFEPIIEAISQAGGDLLHVLEDEKTAAH